MQPITIINTKKEPLNMELLFSVTCKTNGKNYVAINNKDDIFEPNSRYANLDILEIVEERANAVIVSSIPEEEWQTVKQALQFNVFAKMN